MYYDDISFSFQTEDGKSVFIEKGLDSPEDFINYIKNKLKYIIMFNKIQYELPVSYESYGDSNGIEYGKENEYFIMFQNNAIFFDGIYKLFTHAYELKSGIFLVNDFNDTSLQLLNYEEVSELYRTVQI